MSTTDVYVVIKRRIDDHCLKLLTSQLLRYPLVADAASSVRLVVDVQFDYTQQRGLARLDVGYSIISSLPASLTCLSLIISQVDDQNLNDLLLNIVSKYNGGALTLDIHVLHLCTIERAAMLIASHLNQSLPISELLIHDGCLDREEDCLLHLTEALQINCRLTKLQLSNMRLRYTEQNGSSLNRMLRMNQTLKHLDLSGNRTLFTSGAHCIFQGLQHNTTLVHLDLSNTGIAATEDTVQSLTKMLKVNTMLTHLNLSYNTLSDIGAHCIFQGLQHNSTLVHLDLSITGIVAGEDTVQSLAKMLELNKTLTHLNLSNNGLSSDLGAQCIFQGLQHNTTLNSLDLSDTGITNQEALYIARILESDSCSLETLDISQNVISDNGFAHIDKSLEFNTSLKTLIIDNFHYA